MTIVKAGYLYVGGEFRSDLAFAYEDKIIAIESFENLQKRFKDAQVIDCSDKTVMPGLVNVHQHLEFSANSATLTYGSFMPWLHSVIENREELMHACTDELMAKQLQSQLQSGTTTIGEISSTGVDLNACAQAKQRVVFFNELIGSDPKMVDALYGDFNSRLSASKAHTSDRFYPALAIHSPYSVHPILLQKALKQAKKEGLRCSTHFLESKDEQQWLQQNSGGFLEFFDTFFGTQKAINSADAFLDAFTEPTLFTHCNYADSLQKVKLQKHFITHCPVSNRLLGSKKLEIQDIHNLCLATDGLSSNRSLSLFDEMRAALMIHDSCNLQRLSQKLLQAVTTNPAKALKLPIGEIKEGNFADFIVLKTPTKDKTQLPLQLILHTQKASSVYVSGKQVV
ncbi:MAG: aminofutalosine deaminase family hydrolase [Campylobacterota bacterium]